MKVAKVILLQVRLGDLTVNIWLGVVEGLTLKVLLGMSLIEKLIKYTSPMDPVIEPVRSYLVPINDISADEEAAFQSAFLCYGEGRDEVEALQDPFQTLEEKTT